MAYADRGGFINEHGVLEFATSEDAANEAAIKAQLEAAWHCTLHRYPRLHMIDFYAERGGYLVAHVEVKCRSHASTQYPTVYLNMRKYLTLLAVQLQTGIPSIYAVGFADGVVRYIDIADIQPGRVPIRGTDTIVKSSSDREPIIEVPVSSMRAA